MSDAPRAGRPRMPEDYGISKEAPDAEKHPWSDAERELEGSRNYWICSTRSDGRPHAMPVWGVWLDGAVLFSTSRSSTKGRNLARRPDVIVHLESGDDVVLLEGRVEEARYEGGLFARYIDAYEKKYDIRPDPSSPGDVVYRLHPRVALVWSEKDFPDSATRWEFVDGAG